MTMSFSLFFSLVVCCVESLTLLQSSLHLSSSAKQKSIKIHSSLLIILWSRNFVCFNGYTHTHTHRERERERALTMPPQSKKKKRAPASAAASAADEKKKKEKTKSKTAPKSTKAANSGEDSESNEEEEDDEEDEDESDVDGEDDDDTFIDVEIEFVTPKEEHFLNLKILSNCLLRRESIQRFRVGRYDIETRRRRFGDCLSSERGRRGRSFGRNDGYQFG